MARLNVNNLTLDEIHQKVGGADDTTCSLNDTDIRNIAAPDLTYANQYHGNGINTTNESIISMGEFRNGEHTSLEGMSLSNWDTFVTATQSAGSYTQAEATAQISFTDDSTNNRVIVSYYSGTNASMNTVYTEYVNYSGKPSSNPVQVRYEFSTTSPSNGTTFTGTNPHVNIGSSSSYAYGSYGWPGHPSQSSSAGTTSSTHRKLNLTFYDLPTNGGYVPYKYMVRTNATQYSTQYRNVRHLGVRWRLRFQAADGSYVESTSSVYTMELYAFKGAIF